MCTALNTDVAAQLCKVDHRPKFLITKLQLWVFSEVHAHDFGLVLINLLTIVIYKNLQPEMNYKQPHIISVEHTFI